MDFVAARRALELDLVVVRAVGGEEAAGVFAIHLHSKWAADTPVVGAVGGQRVPMAAAGGPNFGNLGPNFWKFGPKFWKFS